MAAQRDRPVDGAAPVGPEIERDLGSDDPAIGLRAVVALRSLADRLESLHVDQARRRGWSWQQIAAALGISRQAAHKKYGRIRR
ncbi:RNA polymerase subunit sigma-70 [Microlunatus soli]|uniref:Homeodomain-like domain-containing protein n=1 Tax=Microlunatus soli TaxID=630515 RepID=A0A1H2ABK6_9ACTN|nr:RNA polymerase subunit sigma-70 [Microlunatus soli]SDT43132.1 hypothetical protein SAMN04489812_5803 [Microlunatus soli]